MTNPASWRTAILKEIAAEPGRLTIVADPDAFLLDEAILEAIHERGYEVLPFDDPIAFRYDYESRFRSRWDRGETADRALIIRGATSDPNELPFDLLQRGRRLSFGLADLFPDLSYPVIAALPRAALESLDRSLIHPAGTKLGNRATADLVLEHVYKIRPDLIRTPADLLAILLRLHGSPEPLPSVIENQLRQQLHQDHRFPDWPLDQIVPDRAAFVAFLQERWPVYVDHLAEAAGVIRESPPTYVLEHAGPADLPFSSGEVKPYVTSLFLDGALRPIAHPAARAIAESWVALGIQSDPKADRKRRIAELEAELAATIPAPDARYQEWLGYARRWADLLALRNDGNGENSDLPEQFIDMRRRADSSFLAWATRRYGGLYNQPAIPVMVHHIPRALARHLGERHDARIALVVLDGTALDQWQVVRSGLVASVPDIHLDEGALFAWVPTITSVSRQAIFAGSTPAHFPDSLLTTDREASQWTRFWTDQGLSPAEIAYAASIRDADGIRRVRELCSQPKLRVAGLIVDQVDRIAHGTRLGTAGLHDQLRLWLRDGFLTELFGLLLDHGFTIFVTADHGNVESVGIGRPTEGSIADSRGQRVRVYPTEALRGQVQAKYPGSVAWPPIGLPDGFLPLLAPARSAFVPSGEIIVSHGGMVMEEVVVPYVRIDRSQR